MFPEISFLLTKFDSIDTEFIYDVVLRTIEHKRVFNGIKHSKMTCND